MTNNKLLKLWVVPNMGASTNREIVQRFMDYSDVFNGMTLNISLQQLKMFQTNGWFTKSECFITLAFCAE